MTFLDYDGPIADDDPRYDECWECKEVGFEVHRCSACGADICAFCDHYCDEDD